MAQIGTIARFEVSGEILSEDIVALLALREAGVPGAEMDKAEEGDFYAAWDLLRDQWQSIRSEVADFDTERLRRRWIIPLLELLGHKPEFQKSHPTMPNGVTVPITHRTETIPVWFTDYAEQPDAPPTEGKRRRSKHELFQEYLDFTDDDWGILCSGRAIRLLTDYHKTLTRNFVEADLESIFDELDVDAFRIVWRLFRASGFVPKAKGIRDVERIRDHSREQGAEIGKELRKQVVEAVVTLANGFLDADETGSLREAMQTDSEGPMRLYQSVLRIVYRMLFLLYVENKQGWTPAQDPRWASGYSISRLRAAAEDPGSFRAEGEDLWEGLKVTFSIIREGCTLFNEPISPYGGELFDDERLWLLGQAPLANAPLLRALYLLTIFERKEKKATTIYRVNFRNLRIDALGSVYESLLEERPTIDAEGRFAFYHRAGKGNKRKETGSYYTPPELVAELIKTALLPVIEDRLREVCKSVGLEVGQSETWLQTVLNDVAAGKQWIQGSPRLATSNGSGGGMSQVDEDAPAGGALRPYIADSQSGGIDTGQRRGGERTGDEKGLHGLPSDREGQSAGIGDTSAASEQAGLSTVGGDDRPRTETHVGRQTAEPPDRLSANLETSKPTDPETSKPTNLQTSKPPNLQSLLRDAILGISVVDPACGSGAFLIQALDALAEALLKASLGDEQPSELQLREARRDVAVHCIHGVDMNAMAVELCKFTLWLHVAHPKFPLSYLEPLIRCGNSLVGVPTAAQIAEAKRIIAEENARTKTLPTYKPKDLQTYTGWEGFDLEPSKRTKVPDEAFSPVGDDDKGYAKSVQSRNRSERAGQLRLNEGQIEDYTHGRLEVYRHMQEIKESRPEDIKEKERRYAAYLKSGAYLLPKRFADAWCSAFFWPLKFDLPAPPTQFELAKLHPARVRASDASPENSALVREVQRRAEALQFFHWELEFPDVFANGGFDVVLGNPPWKKIKLNEQEWFAGKSDAIVEAANKARRAELIEKLRGTDPALYEAFAIAGHSAAAVSKFTRTSRRFPLCAKGDVNLYALFAETDRSLLAPVGKAGFIVPTGIATDDTTKWFFGDLVRTKTIHSFYGFKNERFLFPKPVEHTITFGLLTILGRGLVSDQVEFCWLCYTVPEMLDQRRRIRLRPGDLGLMNPNTRTAPVLRTPQDADLLRHIYERVPVLVNERTGANPWGIRYYRMLDMSTDSKLFHDPPEAGDLPLYEAKMFHQFDHRWATYAGVDPNAPDENDVEGADFDEDEEENGGQGKTRNCTLEEKRDAHFIPTPL